MNVKQEGIPLLPVSLVLGHSHVRQLIDPPRQQKIIGAIADARKGGEAGAMGRGWSTSRRTRPTWRRSGQACSAADYSRVFHGRRKMPERLDLDHTMRREGRPRKDPSAKY
jgi:hypothetical protein